MLDIKLIRENPEKINELLKRRNPDLSIDKVLEIDSERRKIQCEADELRQKRKTMSNEIGIKKKSGENTDIMQAEVKKMGEDIKALEEKQAELDDAQKQLLLTIPNMPFEDVPTGNDDSENPVVKTWGEPTKANFELKPHWDLAEDLGIVDFASSNIDTIGTMLKEGQSVIKESPHVLIFPVVLIAILMICFNLFGNGLRDAFNTTLRGSEE